MRRNPAALPPPKCAPARYLPPETTTAARIPAVLPPPSQDAPASAAGEERGGGSASDSGTNTTSPATPAIYIHLSARCVCKSPNSSLPRGGGLGWGQQKKPHSDNTHTTAPFIAIHRKFQTRRVAEDSTRLYGEATQYSMRLSVDGYTANLQFKCNSYKKRHP